MHGAIGNFWSLLGQATADYTALCDPGRPLDARTLAGRPCRHEGRRASLGKRYTPADPQRRAGGRCRTESCCTRAFSGIRGWDVRARRELPRLLVQNNVTGCTVLHEPSPCGSWRLRRGDPANMYMHDWFLALTAAAFGHVVVPCRGRWSMYRQHGQQRDGGQSAAGLAEPAGCDGRFPPGNGARQRMALTYRHTRGLCRGLCGRTAAARGPGGQSDRYLALEHRPKPARVCAAWNGADYRMQSPVARAGQIFFC